MNLKYSTGQYNCPACRTGGHMLSLYAKLNGMEYAKIQKSHLQLKND